MLARLYYVAGMNATSTYSQPADGNLMTQKSHMKSIRSVLHIKNCKIHQFCLFTDI